jgi:putative phosphoribosyl transferase
MSRFVDRSAAGRELAGHLDRYAGRDDVVVLGLARGGVPVAFEVAAAIGAELDVFVVRKLGVPGHEELAMGAIASGGEGILNRKLVDAIGLTSDEVEQIVARERAELERREREYRVGRSPAPVEGRTVILVDDGLATGSSMRAAVRALRDRDAGEVVVAVPIAPPETCADLDRDADAVVCARTPEPFCAVGAWYENFEQTSDDEVRAILQRSRGVEQS